MIGEVLVQEIVEVSVVRHASIVTIGHEPPTTTLPNETTQHQAEDVLEHPLNLVARKIPAPRDEKVLVRRVTSRAVKGPSAPRADIGSARDHHALFLIIELDVRLFRALVPLSRNLGVGGKDTLLLMGVSARVIRVPTSVRVEGDVVNGNRRLLRIRRSNPFSFRWRLYTAI
jgi:hypothetical protein